MKKISFNEGWFWRRNEEKEQEKRAITLPHDAMLTEKRNAGATGGGWVCSFEGKDYIYTKKFSFPDEYADKDLYLEFEGVYHLARVFINGQEAAFRPYGYTNFYIRLNGYIKFGCENKIEVRAVNSDQPNSRWYSGAGIYRPVWLYVGEKTRVEMNGIKIRTVSINPAVIACEIRTTRPGKVHISIQNKDKVIYEGSLMSERKEDAEEASLGKAEIELSDVELWSPEAPHLYKLRADVSGDRMEETFGIRELRWNAQDGLTINGRRTILRGGCIHHDNGVLGACTYPEAEERRVRLLLKNGYNAIRSAHNPCSKALLDACDRLGMLVMDEYTDMWYIHKTKYDYALYMRDWWREDLKDMVDKDYNHPCVIMYSTGNEVSETARKEGIALTKDMTEYLHSLDSGRPVTCGINIFFNFLSSVGFGVYSDEKAEKEAGKKKAVPKSCDDNKKSGRAVGSEFYNQLAGRLGAAFMKWGATLYPCDLKTRDAFANMDIAGYNYGIRRYRHDLKKYPERLILGTETFCADAFNFWELACSSKRIIGDFVWAGMDYLGEVGAGAQEYEDYAPKNADPSGWICGGGARVNLIGGTGGEAAYTRVAFEQTNGPLICVKPVYQTGKLPPNAWKMTYSLPSWSWDNCEGMPAEIEVYARAYKVKIFINGREAGEKIIKKGCTAYFKLPYEKGELMAVAYDKEGKEIGRYILRSAKEERQLRILPECEEVKEGGLLYVNLRYTDCDGIVKPMEKHRIRIDVKGGKLLGLGSAATYTKDSFLGNIVSTYYGEALAVVKAGSGEKLIICAGDENGETSITVPVVCA